MAKSLYIAAIEPASGKSVVALGIMELLSRRIRNVGYFRPVIPSGTLAVHEGGENKAPCAQSSQEKIDGNGESPVDFIHNFICA